MYNTAVSFSVTKLAVYLKRNEALIMFHIKRICVTKEITSRTNIIKGDGSMAGDHIWSSNFIHFKGLV
jgi:hypothetical protein